MQCTHKLLVWIDTGSEYLETSGQRERGGKRNAMTGLCRWHLQGLVRLWCDKRPSSPSLQPPSSHLSLSLSLSVSVMYSNSSQVKKITFAKKKKLICQPLHSGCSSRNTIDNRVPPNARAFWTPLVFNSNLTDRMRWYHLLCDLFSNVPPPYTRYDSKRRSGEQQTLSASLCFIEISVAPVCRSTMGTENKSFQWIN